MDQRHSSPTNEPTMSFRWMKPVQISGSVLAVMIVLAILFGAFGLFKYQAVAVVYVVCLLYAISAFLTYLSYGLSRYGFGRLNAYGTQLAYAPNGAPVASAVDLSSLKSCVYKPSRFKVSSASGSGFIPIYLPAVFVVLDQMGAQAQIPTKGWTHQNQLFNALYSTLKQSNASIDDLSAATLKKFAGTPANV